eukprot:CAMPEP_0174759476 /NCGR_PEP_ID=MMETSP1094-20130205/108288_1 /TAXON_ID=156173 /ORGANISM="Chrysochromulina brevifilum, Strain UTEX LB 985" /LENGTH=139 /DNA_ID=CAMNT_0015965411 /DNA_START=778 /DNA_END=1194 /DNA_ORIENTATION=-
MVKAKGASLEVAARRASAQGGRRHGEGSCRTDEPSGSLKALGRQTASLGSSHSTPQVRCPPIGVAVSARRIDRRVTGDGSVGHGSSRGRMAVASVRVPRGHDPCSGGLSELAENVVDGGAARLVRLNKNDRRQRRIVDT